MLAVFNRVVGDTDQAVVSRSVGFKREKLRSGRHHLTGGGDDFGYTARVFAPNDSLAQDLKGVELDRSAQLIDFVAARRGIGQELAGEQRASGFDLLQLAIDLRQTRLKVVDLRVIIAGGASESETSFAANPIKPSFTSLRLDSAWASSVASERAGSGDAAPPKRLPLPFQTGFLHGVLLSLKLKVRCSAAVLRRSWSSRISARGDSRPRFSTSDWSTRNDIALPDVVTRTEAEGDDTARRNGLRLVQMPGPCEDASPGNDSGDTCRLQPRFQEQEQTNGADNHEPVFSFRGGHQLLQMIGRRKAFESFWAVQFAIRFGHAVSSGGSQTALNPVEPRTGH